jgi:hypothetical protein
MPAALSASGSRVVVGAVESRAELVAARGLEKGMGGFKVGAAAGAGGVWLGTETRAAFGISGAAAGRFFDGEMGLLDDDD